MKPRIAVLTFVVLVALLFATPVLARHGGGGQADGTFNLFGMITGLDAIERTIEVEVETPAYLDQLNPLTVQTTDNTRFKECDGETSLTIEFGELETGRAVRIAGTVDGESFTAARVIQY